MLTVSSAVRSGERHARASAHLASAGSPSGKVLDHHRESPE